jgi:hypothetical protein
MPIRPRRARLTPHQWIRQIFLAQAARNGGVVRRKIDSVARFASHQALEAEVRRRGFHMVISGDQYVILCNAGQFQVIC